MACCAVLVALALPAVTQQWAETIPPVAFEAPTIAPAGQVTFDSHINEHAHARVVVARRASPKVSRGGLRSCDAACLAAIARCESVNGAYTFRQHTNPKVSGKYGVKDSTWDGYAGYARAMDAPEATQDAWAREAAAKAGTRPWVASRACHGQ